MNEQLMTLNELAIEVNGWLECATAAQDQAGAARISAGKTLAEAKERVRAGELGHKNWSKWVRESLTVSYRDADKCIALARSPDPIAAVSRARAVKPLYSTEPRSTFGETFDPGAPSELHDAETTFGRIQQDILALSAEDRIALTEWLASGAEVQRDLSGNVLDPLPVRLRRVLHRLKRNRSPGNFGPRFADNREFDDGLRELEEIIAGFSEPELNATSPSTWTWS